MLKQFYLDKKMSGEVKDFMVQYIKDLAVRRALNGSSTESIKEMVDMVEGVWKEMESMFEPKEEKEIINEAR